MANMDPKPSARQSQMDKLDAQLADLKIQRNALAPISILPDELLGEIFVNCAVTDDVFSTASVSISLVCRRWASVASSHAKLWSYVGHYSPADWSRTNLRLRRSKEHPLTCDFSIAGENSAWDVSTVLLAHGHRVRHLNIHTAVDRDGLETAFAHIETLPMLNTLSLSLDAGEHYDLPGFMLDGGAPQLRNISLYGIGFTGWNHLSNLTELKLCQRADGNALLPAPSFGEFSSFLRRSPQLRTLKLDHFLPHTIAIDISIDGENAVIDLPHLESLQLTDSLEQMQSLLQVLTIPSSTSLNIIGGDAGDVWFPNDVVDLAKCIRLHLRNPGAPTLRFLGIYLSVGLRGHTVITADPASGDGEHAHFSLSARLSTGSTGRGVIYKILDSIPLDSVTYLHATQNPGPMDQPEVSHTIWRAIYQRLPRVEVVRTPIDEYMVQVVQGLVGAVQRGARGLSGKKKRRAEQAGLAPPSRLELVASPVKHPDTALQVLWFSALDALLTVYKSMDAPFKLSGVPLGTLSIQGVLSSRLEVHRFRERLHSRVGQLVIDGRPWDPVTWRKMLKQARRERRALTVKYGEDRDEPLSSDSEPEVSAGGAAEYFDYF
ncbi:hypothetical protein FA95DRAFT_1516858 [Auriscalpium vulgare]|uniref:Uncharacterized protein n=1 Tax=Auriscalpium vulgare TaxID=40419 RepID=A0ACB8RWZ8_9AGAM|nr:hypothetical protein FA95DRAFT_1516858 [Auriscalpium vulgare]